MYPVPLVFAILLSLPTCETQPMQGSKSFSGSTSNSIKSMLPKNEDGDYRLMMPVSSTQKVAEKQPLNAVRAGVTQLESTPRGRKNLFVRRDNIFRQNLLRDLERTFKQTRNFRAYGPELETYPLLTDLQRSRGEFERRKQMALNRFRNAGNNLSNGNKRDQGRPGTFNNHAVPFTSQNRLPERQVSQVSNIPHTGSWTKRHPSSPHSSPSEQTAGAQATNGQEQEVERQESEHPGASSLPSGLETTYSSVNGSPSKGSSQAANANANNGQEGEIEGQPSEYSGTETSAPFAGKAPGIIKANSPVSSKQRPKETTINVHEQEVERQNSGSPILQHSVKMPTREDSTMYPPWQHQKAPIATATNESPWKNQISNSEAAGGSLSNESFENYARGATPGISQKKETLEKHQPILNHDYHYERVERMDRTLRILSRLGLGHIIPFITFQFMHNHPYALPLPHFPFLLDPEYFVHTGNSD